MNFLVFYQRVTPILHSHSCIESSCLSELISLFLGFLTIEESLGEIYLREIVLHVFLVQHSPLSCFKVQVTMPLHVAIDLRVVLLENLSSASVKDSSKKSLLKPVSPAATQESRHE